MNTARKKHLKAKAKSFLHFIKRNVTFYAKYRKRNYDLLEKNRELQGVLEGKRCFIIGNGPSLKEQDLTPLRDEVVFTVNQAVRHGFFKDIRTNFHLWTDPNLFVIDENSDVDKTILDMMRNVYTEDNEPVCFFPANQKAFVQRHGLDQHANIHYLAPELGWLYDYFDEPLQLHRQIPVYGTVVQFAITAAIYMGASEIYLLGCDNTGIMNSVTSILRENDGSNYGYEISETEKKRMERTAARNGLELDTLSYYNNIKSYRILAEYCQKRNIKLVNCSARTVIESIPRETLENVLNNRGGRK